MKPADLSIHPLAWLITIGLDTLVFGGNLGMFAGYLLLAVASAPFFAVVLLLQHFAAGDRWRIAAAKAAVLLALVLIPTPIASVLAAAGSLLTHGPRAGRTSGRPPGSPGA